MPRTHPSEEISVDLETLDDNPQKPKDYTFNKTVSRDPLSNSITDIPDSVENINATNAKTTQMNASMSDHDNLLSENDNLVSELNAELPHSLGNFSSTNKSGMHNTESEKQPMVEHRDKSSDWSVFATGF